VPLSRKVVLIAGATGPVGGRLIGAFSAAGAQLALCVRRLSDMPDMERTLKKLHTQALVIPCDLRFEEDVVRLVHRVIQRLGRIDVVVNAASVVGPRLTVSDYPIEPWRNVFATNVTGTYLLCREVSPWMRRQGGGSIINVTSSMTATPQPQLGAYYVAAQSIEGLTKLLALELKDDGVRVNTIRLAEDAVLPDQEDPQPDWTRAFLWLAGDDSIATSGTRIATAEFATIS